MLWDTAKNRNIKKSEQKGAQRQNAMITPVLASDGTKSMHGLTVVPTEREKTTVTFFSDDAFGAILGGW